MLWLAVLPWMFVGEFQPAHAQQLLGPQPNNAMTDHSLPPGVRRVRIMPRNDLGLTNAEWLPGGAGGGESIAVISGGINVVIDGLEDFGVIDIVTDRAVIWTDLGGLDLVGESRQQENVPLEFYLEGNIEFRQGDRVIFANAMYYDVRRNIGEVLNAELLTPVPEYEGKIRVQAERMRQIAEHRFAARNARFTTSRMGQPGYYFQSRDVVFDDLQRPAIDPITGQQLIDPRSGPVFEHDRTVTGANNTVVVEGVPILYWPNFKTDLNDPGFYLTELTFRDDSIFGTQVRTEWNLYQLLGLGKGLPDTQWDLSVDYLSLRGLGVGTTFDYHRNPITGSPRATGLFDAWGLHDDGHDNLGLTWRNLIPETDYRGRIRFEHREEFDDGYRLRAQVGLISDRNFLNQYFEREWDTLPDQLTRLALQRIVDNRTWTIGADVRLNDFFTQTDWWPRGDHYWLGQPLLFDRLTWFEHSSAGYARLRTASAPQDPAQLAQFLPMAWEVPQSGERLVTRQELDLPFSLGPVNVVPYALGELAHWGSDLTGDPIQRAYGQLGVRTNLSMWRVDPCVESHILNVHGLAHKVDFSAEFALTDANQNFTAFPLYDPLDDDAIEAFRRRYPSQIFGGGPIPLAFDERYYAIRNGIAGWVAAPATEMVDDLTVFRLGMRNRWQTKRGAPGYGRIVDWITLDTNVSLFPRDDENFGQPIGLLDYDFRWHAGDRVTFTSAGIFDMFDNGQKLISVGAVFNRPDRGNLYLGFRSLQGPINSQVGIVSFNYRLSPKYIASYATTYDFADDGNLGQRLAVTRIGESFLIRAGFSYDRSQDNFGASFSIEPRMFRQRGHNLIEGIHVPPAGALGLE